MVHGKGKGARASIKYIEKNGQTMTEPSDIANTIGEAISHNSSSTHYSPKSHHIVNREGRHPFRVQSDNTESYNQPFSVNDLFTVLVKIIPSIGEM